VWSGSFLSNRSNRRRSCHRIVAFSRGRIVCEWNRCALGATHEIWNGRCAIIPFSTPTYSSLWKWEANVRDPVAKRRTNFSLSLTDPERSYNGSQKSLEPCCAQQRVHPLMTHSHGRIDLATRKLCVSVPWDCAAYDAPNQIQHQSPRLIINSRQGFFEIEEHCQNRSRLLKRQGSVTETGTSSI
jgi:hypothetical protein